MVDQRGAAASHVFFLEDPSERAAVVREHLADTLVAHLRRRQLLGEELVLLSYLGFRAHAPDYERPALHGSAAFFSVGAVPAVMKIRGLRECRDCEHRWSYYETGAVDCPACGSLRSVGVDERTRHTDAPASLDLSAHRRTVDEDGVSAVAEDLKRDLRRYRNKRGFIRGGELVPLDETYLAATELLHAVDVLARADEVTDDEEFYLLDLLRGADSGERPDVREVPTSMRAARGLAVAEAVTDYRTEVLSWLDDNPDPTARRVLGTIAEHAKRIRALDGDVPLATSEALVDATRDVSTALREDDETALSRARDRLSRLE